MLIRKPSLLFIFCILFCITSCKDQVSKNNKLNPENLADATSAQEQNSISGSIIPFPSNVAILLPTQYRKESGYPENVKEKDWYELFKDPASGKWLIQKANLKISFGRDECVGDDVMIVKSGHDDAVVFFTAIPELSEKPVTAIENKALFPGRTASLRLNNIEYGLSAEGFFMDAEGNQMNETEMDNLTEAELADSHIKSYQLYFQSPGSPAFLVASIDLMEYVTPKVLWSGDLNGDGYPDIILNLPDFYETRHVFFFMSDPSDRERPLKKVAEIKVVNDC